MSVLVYDCGSVENTVTAILDTESGAMIIRGNGDIDNYADESSPWYSEHSDIIQVTIDKGITRIGSGTFYGCENLSFVEIANTVTSIGADVFQDCTSLTSIKIPKSITDIGNGTFADSGLTEVKFYGNPPTVGTDIFDGVTADVYTPEGNEEWTETAKGTVAGNGSNLTWKEFDSKPNLIEYDELDYLWSKIKKYVDNNVSVTQVISSGTKIATITINGVATDIYSSGGLSGTVGSSTTPIYIDNGVPTACGGSLDVDITGNATTATTASKLSNTTAIGNVSTPVYINANGVPTTCNKFASASIAASNSTKTPAGWFRIFSLNGYENGIIIVGGGGFDVSGPCYAILSFSISNNRPNISLISSGNTTTGAGGSTTKIRITCSASACYVEAYNNPTEQTRYQYFRIFTNVSSVTGYNITAGSSPNGEELAYTATVDINKNTEPCLHTTDSAIGSASKPVYVDANGVVQACTSVDLNATSANNVQISTLTDDNEHPFLFGTTFTNSTTNQAIHHACPNTTANNCAFRGRMYLAPANTQGRASLILGNALAKTSANNARGELLLYGTGTTYLRFMAGDVTATRTITLVNGSADATLTLPSATGTIALTSSDITGNAATATSATKATMTAATAATWYSLVATTYDATSGTAYGMVRLNNANSRPDAGLYYDANATSGNQRVILNLGNATANTTAAGKNGLIQLWGTGTTSTCIVAGNPSSSNTVTLPTGTGTLALVENTYDDTTNTSYRGMRGLNGSTSSWVRTTSAGILPSQSGAAGSGHCGLGTSTWYFATAYIDNIYGKLNGNCTGSSASCTGNAATATTASACSGNAASATYATNVRITPSDGTTAYPVTMLNGSTASTDYALRTAVNNTTVANSGLKCIPGADVAANNDNFSYWQCFSKSNGR